MPSAGAWKRLADLDLKGRRLLLRAEFNTPLAADGQVADDARIRAALPGIRFAHAAGASVVIMSHLGRPPGRREERRTLAPVARRLRELLGSPVRFFPDQPGPLAECFVAAAREIEPGETLLLENLRFHPGETANDPDFARELAGLGDCYANDAFGVAHRANASVDECARIFRERRAAAAGPLMEKEIAYLQNALDCPERPFVAILGGSKIGDKLPAARRLAEQADRLLIGGPMAYPFVAAQGRPAGWDVYPQEINKAEKLLAEWRDAGWGHKITLPTDHIVARHDSKRRHPAGPGKECPVTESPKGSLSFDIGPRTRQSFIREIERAKTVFWNGPMGAYKRAGFKTGTEAVIRAVAAAAKRGAMTVVGGGHTVALVQSAGIGEEMTHLSTGGGAMLAVLAGQSLPGLEALR